MRCLPALCSCLLLLVAAAAAGCGEGEVASGATVSVYAPASLCGEARTVGRTRGWRVDKLTVRLVCLPPPERNGRANLATAGANARRATEDSTSVAFLEEPTPAAGFSRSIVEAADIAWIEAPSGAAAMRQVIGALEERGSSTPRRAVLDQLG